MHRASHPYEPGVIDVTFSAQADPVKQPVMQIPIEGGYARDQKDDAT